MAKSIKAGGDSQVKLYHKARDRVNTVRIPYLEDPCQGRCQQSADRLPNARPPLSQRQAKNRYSQEEAPTQMIKFPLSSQFISSSAKKRRKSRTAPPATLEKKKCAKSGAEGGLFPELASRHGGHSHFFRAWQVGNMQEQRRGLTGSILAQQRSSGRKSLERNMRDIPLPWARNQRLPTAFFSSLHVGSDPLSKMRAASMNATTRKRTTRLSHEDKGSGDNQMLTHFTQHQKLPVPQRENTAKIRFSEYGEALKYSGAAQSSYVDRCKVSGAAQNVTCHDESTGVDAVQMRLKLVADAQRWNPEPAVLGISAKPLLDKHAESVHNLWQPRSHTQRIGRDDSASQSGGYRGRSALHKGTQEALAKGAVPYSLARELEKRKHEPELEKMPGEEKCKRWLLGHADTNFAGTVIDPYDMGPTYGMASDKTLFPPVAKITLCNGISYYLFEEENENMPHWDKTANERCEEFTLYGASGGDGKQPISLVPKAEEIQDAIKYLVTEQTDRQPGSETAKSSVEAEDQGLYLSPSIARTPGTMSVHTKDSLDVLCKDLIGTDPPLFATC